MVCWLPDWNTHRTKSVEELLDGYYRYCGKGKAIVVLSLDQPVDAKNENTVPKKLGPPIDIQIVSPPIFDPEEPAARPPWDSKYSYCYLFHSRKVWFGFEKFGAAEKLTSITIHYE